LQNSKVYAEEPKKSGRLQRRSPSQPFMVALTWQGISRPICPRLRARAIPLISTSPPQFNFCDLKNDVNAGPVCCNPGNVQAWDVRSYKAAQWVLRNWRMLIS
jgi:hypothetical protein